MGRLRLLEFFPYRRPWHLGLLLLRAASLLFLPHKINEAVQYRRMAVQRIVTADRIRMIIWDDACPFLVTAGIPAIPILKLDGVGKNKRNSFQAIANSCDTPPKQSGNRLLSTKSDTQAHGFGLKSVKKTIQKYQGDYEWNYDVDAKQFTMTVMIVDREITRYR